MTAAEGASPPAPPAPPPQPSPPGGGAGTPPIPCRLAPAPGPCRECRHSNQGTLDYQTGHVACRFKGGVPPDATCDLVARTKEGALAGYFFERYDGANGTFQTPAPVRFSPSDRPPVPPPSEAPPRER